MGKKPKKGGQGQTNPVKQYKKLSKEKHTQPERVKVLNVTHESIPAQAQQQKVAETSGSMGAQTLQQQRAKYALRAVKEALKGGVDAKEFKSYAAGFPAMIQMNGLGQAAAFYFSQDKTYRKLYDILSGWITRDGQAYSGYPNDLLAGITSEDMHRYRIAQAEALLLLDWVKRFSKAFTGGD